MALNNKYCIVVLVILVIFFMYVNIGYANNFIPSFNVDGLPLNYKIWQDMNLIAYGDFLTANTRTIDIKYYHDEKYQDMPLYFVDPNGIPCEYRYLGYTYEGNKMPNPFFPKDSSANTALDSRLWYKKPWKLSNNYLNEKSQINKAVSYNLPGANIVREYIESTVDFNILRAYDAQKKQVVSFNTQPDLVQFVNVESVPSTLNTGLARMLHKTKHSDWYQTFTIPQVKRKNETLISVQGDITNLEEIKFTPLDNKKTALVSIVAKLNDEAYFNPNNTSDLCDQSYMSFLQSSHYHRYDIEKWEIVVFSNGEQHIKTSHTNYGVNGVKETFRIDLSKEIIESNNIAISGKVIVHYVTGETSEMEFNVGQIDFTDSQFVRALFTANTDIKITEEGDITTSILNYQDFSQGDIDTYFFELKNLITGEKTDFYRGSSSNVFVNFNFYNFVHEDISSALAQLPAIGDQYFEYKLTQRVVGCFDDDVVSQNIRVSVMQEYQEIKIVSPSVTIPREVFDISPLGAIDSTDLANLKNVTVNVDNIEVDYNLFFSSSYNIANTIGELGENDKNILISLRYQSEDNINSYVYQWVKVKTSLPKVEVSVYGKLMENREISLVNNSINLNERLMDKFTLEYNWTYELIDGSGEILFDNKDESLKTFIVKGQSIYRFTLEVSNGSRITQPYSIDIPIYQDNPPAVIFNMWNTRLTRGENLVYDYSADSLEGDIITNEKLQIWFDKDNTEEYTELVLESCIHQLEDISFDKLGRYKLIVQVEEEFGHDTILQFVTEHDRQTTILTKYFEVANLSPLIQIYTNKPNSFANLDVLIMLDESLSQDNVSYVYENRVNITNNVRRLGYDARVKIWDLNTYQNTKQVNTAHETGEEYPPEELYFSQEGYLGVLQLENVVNDSYYEDQGRYISVTNSKTVYETTIYYCWTMYNQDGSIMGQYNHQNSPISYNQDGFSGTLHHYNSNLIDTTYDYYDDGSIRMVTLQYLGYYQGTVSKTETVWESDWVLVNDYTGYYNGEAVKSYKQEFTDEFRVNSAKYIIYLTDDDINSITDLTMVESLVGKEAEILTFADNEKGYLLIENIEDISQALSNMLDTVSDYLNLTTILLEEEMSFFAHVVDPEGDPISKTEWQVVQNPYAFDNPNGYASFASYEHSLDNYQIREGTYAEAFSKKGLYTIYARAKDSPSSRGDLSEFSNEASFTIAVHEKPIADFIIDYVYRSDYEMYELFLIDLSYDPDFQFSREDKGIKERRLKFIAGDKLKYELPRFVEPGTYQIEYIVSDIYGAWSEVKEKTLELSEEPKIKIINHIYYKHGDNIIFYEIDEHVIDYESNINIQYQAKDFTPLYDLISSNSVVVNGDKNNLSTTVVFYYEISEFEDYLIEVNISGERFRNDNTIASGYGFELEVDILGMCMEAKSEVDVKAIWLLAKEYEWVLNHVYQVSNEYSLELRGESFILEENPDSSINSRVIFIPVELSDGTYQGTIVVSNIRKKTYSVDENGKVVLEGHAYVEKEVPFYVKVHKSMYDDINIIS